MAAVAKAAALLHAFGADVHTLTVRQLSERTAIPRSTVHVLATTLCEAALLEEVHGHGYRLGPGLVGLGGQVIDRTGLVTAAEGCLDRLLRSQRPGPGQGQGHEAHLGQLVDGWVVYLERAAGPARAPMRNRVGMRAPAHLTGCGKAALAQLPNDEAERRVRATCLAERRPLPDLDALSSELDTARRRGHVVSSSFQPGRTSVAAPILDAAAQPVGGVSLAGPTASFTPSLVARAARETTAIAGEVSARLAGR